jgi:hypothetical protein
MTVMRKIFTASIVALGLMSTIAATPASAGGYYYHRHGPDAGAVAGAVIGRMALGAAIGAATSQPHYYGYGYPARAYGYGYAPYGYYGYGW